MRNNSQPANIVGADAAPALVCRVQGRLCALPLAHVQETMRPLPVQPWPQAPEGVRGVAILRGAPVPVIEGARLLADAPAEAPPGAPAGRFVSLAVGGRRVALAVDEVLGVARVAAGVLPPLLQQTGAVAAIGVRDAGLLAVLETARLLPESLPELPAGELPA